jgi:hypothetical protein
MHFYSAYGLSIQSELELPELVATDESSGAVAIRFGKVEPLPAEVDSQFHSFWASPHEVCLCFREGGAYLVRTGKEIIVQPFPNVAEEVIRLGILGPALSMLLHQRGLLVLHGSAIKFGRRQIDNGSRADPARSFVGCRRSGGRRF